MARKTQLNLPAGKVLTVTAGAGSSGTVRRLAPSGDTTTNYAPAALAATETLSLGPFTNDRAYEIITDVGPALTYDVAAPDTLDITEDNVPAGTIPAWGDITGDLEDQEDLQEALDAKQASLGFTAEDVANKSTDVTADGASDTKYPSVKAVKTYVDDNGGGGSFLSANIARVDPSGSDETGEVGNLNKPFLTGQGAIYGFENRILAIQFEVKFDETDPADGGTYIFGLDTGDNPSSPKISVWPSISGDDFLMNFGDRPVTIPGAEFFDTWHTIRIVCIKTGTNQIKVLGSVAGYGGASGLVQLDNPGLLDTLWVGGTPAYTGVAHRSFRNISIKSTSGFVEAFEFDAQSFDSLTAGAAVVGDELQINSVEAAAYATKTLAAQALADSGSVDTIYPCVDIGNNALSEDLTTSLPTLIITSPGSLSAFNSLTFLFPEGISFYLVNCGNPGGNISCASTTLSIYLSESHIGDISNSVGEITVTASASGITGVVFPGTNVMIAFDPVNFYGSGLVINAPNGDANIDGALVNSVIAADTLTLGNGSRVLGANNADTTIYYTRFVFPDSDPGIAGAGYWSGGVLTKSTG